MRVAKILNVDDREVNRYLRSEALRSARYHIIEATRGRDALEACITEQPDLVLLDVHLPDMSGLEVCRLIKADKRTSSVMVIQVSASAVHFSDAVRGLDTGADDYLVEPVEPELLLAKVRSMLRLRTAEQELRRRNEDLRQFAYAVSHDLQEPLRGIASYADLLKRRYRADLGETASMYLSQVMDGARRLSRLVTDLLEYSQLSTEMDETPALVNLGQIVEKVVALNESRIRESGAHISCSPLPVVRGNEARLIQLFTNLIGNALKYSRPGVAPRIQIESEHRGPEWLISVKDNGQGFRAESPEQVFGVFRRLHGREIPGSGIGLAICKAVVERVGGRIWAESVPGEGSVFRFTWPVVVDAAEASV